MEYGDGPPYADDDGYEYDPEGWGDEPDLTTTELAATAPEPEVPPAALTETVVLSARLQSIVDAAQRSAEELRLHTEQRAVERIAEADRAGEYRVQAAEEEAAELVAEAHAQAAQLAAEAVNAVDSIHAEAHAKLREANEALEQAHRDAEQRAKETIERARNDARELVRAAELATGDVIDDGTELSDQLRELSNSLRSNAERLLRDIRLAHGSMTARLDQASPDREAFSRSRGRSAADSGDAPAPARRRPRDDEAAVDFEVPDFVIRDE